MSALVRILLLADTHLGFDLPLQPRVQRRRRGQDFLANYATALQPALAGEVDVVVHGGDVFNRSRPHASVAYQAFEPLARVADAGVPVFVVPGNHERGQLPHLRFARHPGIHIFDRPRTFVVDVRGTRVALAGFPSERTDVRTNAPTLIAQAAWREASADLRLLCLHQAVEGATVGPADFMFTTAQDVVRCRDLPGEFAAVFAGHIHRHQVLQTDLRGQPLAAPVLYPGSIERTSIAEAAEEKGYMIVEVARSGGEVGLAWRFCRLPARPLVTHDVPAGLVGDALVQHVKVLFASLPADAVVTLRVRDAWGAHVSQYLSAKQLRALAPDSMNVEFRLAEPLVQPWGLSSTHDPTATGPGAQLSFPMPGA